MTVRRRTVVKWCGVVGAVALAGCTGAEEDADESSTDGESSTEDGETATEVDADAPFEATLVLDDETTLFTAAEIASVGSISESDRTGLSMPIDLTDEGTRSVIETARELDLSENAGQAEIVISLDGDQINSFGIAQSLAESWGSGEWDGQLILTFEDREAAERVRNRLLGDE